jgi:hypothetical protein
MSHTQSTFDDFCPALDVIRKEVIADGFTTVRHTDGLEYKGTNRRQYPGFFIDMAAASGHAIMPKLSCFRLSLKSERPHSDVHADQVESPYAAVLYMNPDPAPGGTMFYRHRATGLYGMPTIEDMKAAGIKTKKEQVKFGQSLQEDAKGLKHWDMHSLSGARWNRLIMYRSNLWHSRWPLDSYGKTPDTGRLIWVCFFHLLPVNVKLPKGVKRA